MALLVNRKSTYKTTHIYKRGPDNRTRFNRGFGDGVACVRYGWKCVGSDFKTIEPADVLAQHPDHVYARGWMAGYTEAISGKVTATGQPASEPAWQAALVAGQVNE
jgi:hypothetical protein